MPRRDDNYASGKRPRSRSRSNSRDTNRDHKERRSRFDDNRSRSRSPPSRRNDGNYSSSSRDRDVRDPSDRSSGSSSSYSYSSSSSLDRVAGPASRRSPVQPVQPVSAVSAAAPNSTVPFVASSSVKNTSGDAEVGAKKAAEQAVLDEEIRRRRERVKAWQQERAKQAAGAGAAETVTSTTTENGSGGGETGESGRSGKSSGGGGSAGHESTAGAVLSGGDGLIRSSSSREQSFVAAMSQMGSRRVLKSRRSKWDAAGGAGGMATATEADVSLKAGVAPVLPCAADSAAPSAISISAVAVEGSGSAAGEVDPLDSFMSSLYDSGEVENQKELKQNSAANVGNHATYHTGALATINSAVATQKEKDDEEAEDELDKLIDDDDDEEYDESKLDNFASNIITLDEIMLMSDASAGGDSGTGAGAGKPVTAAGDVPLTLRGKRSLAMRRGWESDVASSVGDADDDGDSLFNGGNQQMIVDSTVAETEEEREARELREKEEFIEAIRRSREEEQRVRERWMQSDAEELKAAAAAAEEERKKLTRTEMGRVFAEDGDVMDEFEIAEKKKGALELLEEAKRGKVLKEIDHSQIEYIPFRKNLYIVPRALSRLTPEQVADKREGLQIKVRGRNCTAPVDTWEQCGLSDRILGVIQKHQLKEPFSIQKQAIPAIMCGRDVIGVAKTGSGKTLAFLLPMFRHIQDQPPLRDGEGPIGLIMAPARELAHQINAEARKFCSALGIRVTCIYGGAGVAEQIADLKRGSSIVVCTPGRMIDILCMQAGKMVSLKRVTMVVLDEADRMFDMGFEPQIKMIMQNVRPDRQTVLFSATFPKQIEKLAKSVLKFPLEIVVGERSTVNKDITQYVEVRQEEDKFLRLLQLLGVWYEKGSVLVFVDKQEKCDQLFQDLLKLGYPCLSLHGGKDQVDREHTLHEFKTGIKTVMIATSVAGRGLDVPDIVLVINFNCPNHLEDYVHRVGRTGRAGRKGTAYTFISSKEEQYSPIMVKALEKAGRDVPRELSTMCDEFMAKVERGEAHGASDGFHTKGFTFDATEMNEAQKIASMQRRAYEIEHGLVPVDAAGTGDSDDEQDGPGGRMLVGTGTDLEGQSNTGAGGSGLGSGAATAATTGGSGASLPLAPKTSTSGPSMAATTPLEKAKAMAAAIAAGGKLGAAPAGAGVVPAAAVGSVGAAAAAGVGVGSIDAQAAIARAKLIAQQLVSGGVVGGGAGAVAGAGGAATAAAASYYAEELEINDYPALARRKVTQKNVMDEICANAGVAVISRGSYVAPGKKPEGNERRLHLLIEGNSEMSVRQARVEILRQLEEETMRIGTSLASGIGGGRYAVL